MENEEHKVFVHGGGPGWNANGTHWDKYAYEYDMRPRSPIMSAVGTAIVIPIMVMILLGFWIWNLFAPMEDVAPFVRGPFAGYFQPAPDTPSVTDEVPSMRARVTRTVKHWVRDYPIRCVFFILSGVIVVYHFRIRYWKRECRALQMKVDRVVAQCEGFQREHS